MLAVSTEKGFIPIVNRKNFKVIYDYEGGQTLSFEIATNDKNYQFFYEENRIRYNDNEFKIKKKNQRKTKTSISASLNMDEWKGNFYHQFHETYKLFTEIVNLIIPSGWTVEGAGTVTGRHTVDIEGGSSYDILMQCKSVYGIVYEYHILKKTIKVVKPDTFQSRGLYITDELNLRNLEFKGDSSDFVTRLYAFGKKTEEKDEEGNVTKVSYVTFADINGGKAYVDNNDYSERIIVSYWQDDRYTDPESLLNDAVDKLKSLSIPVRSYSCDLIDLSRINDKYKYLDFTLYDKVTLLDSVSKTYVQHQIVEYVDYPDNRNNNTVSLSSVFKKITGTIDGIKQSISNIDTELLRKESTINEIIRDVKSNTLRINNTYTKGEVDAIEESIIQQTSDSIDLAVQKIENKIQEIDTSLFTYELLNDGTNITEDSNVILSANVFNKGEDITDTLEDIAFKWIRQSKDSDGDQEWNDKHKAMKTVTLTSEDVDVSAVFYCQITMDFGIQHTQSLTITDQTDIAQLGNSFLDADTSLIQTLENDVYFPDWKTSPVIVTPSIIDGMINVDVDQCSISFKRMIDNTETDLTDGETVENNTLKISKNILSKSSPSVTYVCYVSYKNSSIKLFISFYLNIVAKDGNDGADGTDGKDGKGIKTAVTTYQASSSGTVVPTGTWSSSIPSTNAGQYLWTRTITTYTDNSTSTAYSVGRNGTNGADAAIMSDTAPADKNKLWYDTANDLLKYWDGEAWVVVNDYADDMNNMKQQITTEYTSSINQLKESLTSLVEKLQTTTTENTTSINSLSSQIAQNATSITMATTSIQEITDKLTGLTTKEEISKWARYEDGILELGSSDSPFAVKLSQTELGFYQNGTRIAYLSNQQLNISQAVVMQQINIGTFQIIYDADYGLMFM